jgi:hypothetical protein
LTREMSLALVHFSGVIDPL